MRQVLSERVLIISAFIIIYIVWGSTYLANIIAIDVIPPFMLVCTRLLAAGSVLFLLVKAIGKWRPVSSVQWKNLVISSLLFLGIGLTAVVWAQQFIDSGVTSLVISLEPLTVVLVMWAWDRKTPKWSSFVGVLLGMLGMYFLVSQQDIVASWNDWLGILAIVVAILCWAFGSNFITKNDLPKNKLQTASLQMLVSGIVVLPLALMNGDFVKFQWSALTPDVVYAWLFLVTCGSILAYTAFNYLLKKTTPDKVATSTYVHPIVAISLGWYFRDELISNQTLLAASIMLIGVFFINSNIGKKQNATLIKSKE